MCRVRCTGFARSCVRLIGCQNWAASSVMVTALLLLGSADGQATRLKRAPAQQNPPKETTIVLSASDAVATSPSAPPAVVNLPPAAPAVEQPPSQPPVISWDGKQLTIDAENASLSDILLAIRARTGASIEMPPSTSAERVAVHMGPAPVREVLSSLLYGTDFNYVIQSSDGDEQGLGKVIISSREKDAEDASGTTVAGRSVRLMPGYAAPGKRDFEVRHENTDNDASAQAESPNPLSEVASQPAPDPGTDNSQATNRADAQPNPTAASDSGDNSQPSSNAGLASMGLSQPTSQTPIASSSEPGSNEGSPISKMEQDLQRMYQQRRQMQAQQGHSQSQGAPN